MENENEVENELDFLLDEFEYRISEAAQEVLTKYGAKASDLIEQEPPLEPGEKVYLNWYEAHENWKLYANEILELTIEKVVESLDINT